MFEKWILYYFIRGIVMSVYFEFTVPLKAYNEVLIFLNINPCCSNYSTLLPTKPETFWCCCSQHRKIIIVVAYNADHFSSLLPTMRKSTLISVHVCFSVLLPTQRKNYWRCWQQRRKMFDFKHIHEFETICEFTLGFQSGA
jgi:hypothetical protein